MGIGKEIKIVFKRNQWDCHFFKNVLFPFNILYYVDWIELQARSLWHRNSYAPFCKGVCLKDRIYFQRDAILFLRSTLLLANCSPTEEVTTIIFKLPPPPLVIMDAKLRRRLPLMFKFYHLWMMYIYTWVFSVIIVGGTDCFYCVDVQ